MNINEQVNLIPEQYNKNMRKEKVSDAEIVVHGTIEKPYYEIKYYDLSDKQYHIGYSSYDLNNVFKWREECFEIVKTNENDMISEQVEELRIAEETCKQIGRDGIAKFLSEAADTIESLSTKLQAVGNGGWIACNERFPDKIGKYIIHTITGTGEDYVGMWLYERGFHLSGKQYWIDDKHGYWASPYNGDPINEPLSKNVVEWQPLPEVHHHGVRE